MIPEDWSVHTIGQVLRLLNGRAFGPEDWKQQGIPIIRIQNLNDPESSFNYFSKPVDQRHLVEIGDVLFAWSGTTGTSFGARIWGGPTGVLNQHIFKVIPDKNRLTAHYSFFVLLRVQGDINKKAHGFKSSFVHVKKSDLVAVQLPVPPLPEQRAIVRALTDVDTLIRAQDQLIAKKRHIKQAAMQQLLTGQQRLPGFFGKWELRRLGDIADIVSGGTPMTSVEGYWKGSIRWCTPSDVTGCSGKYLVETERTISAEGLASCSSQLLPTGTLLLCSRATIGEVRIAGCITCTNQGFKALICRQGVSNEFLYYKLLTMKPQMVERAIGSTFLEISKKDTASLEVRIPPYQEQTAIATVLSDMDAEIAALEQKRDKTQALKQGMMQELLTGRTRLV